MISSSNNTDEEKAKQQGFDAFCMKPLDVPELLQTVRRGGVKKNSSVRHTERGHSMAPLFLCPIRMLSWLGFFCAHRKESPYAQTNITIPAFQYPTTP